jgi:hypothetical protein
MYSREDSQKPLKNASGISSARACTRLTWATLTCSENLSMTMVLEYYPSGARTLGTAAALLTHGKPVKRWADVVVV